MERLVVTPPLCIFCDTELGPDTKPEHVFLSALGGRKTTRFAICSKHNGDFGATIDDALAKQVAFIRNQLQLESGSRKPPPGLGEVQAGSRTVRIAGDGQPHLTEKPFEITRLGDGQAQVRITVSSEEQLTKLLPHIAAQIGISKEQLHAQFAGQEVSVISERLGQILRHNPLGGALECRSMLKACLVLWSTEVGNTELKGTTYAAARDRVISGGDFPSSLDSRPLPFRDALVARYGRFFNLIYVTSDPHGRVLAHFTMYNLVGWRFVLAESGGMPNRKIALISNPQNPSVWSDEIAAEFDLGLAWLEEPHFETSGPQGQLAAIIEQAHRKGFEREIGRIVDEVWRKNGLEPNQGVSDPDLLNAVTGEIALRMAHHHMALPFEEKITGAELLARIQKNPKP